MCLGLRKHCVSVSRAEGRESKRLLLSVCPPHWLETCSRWLSCMSRCLESPPTLEILQTAVKVITGMLDFTATLNKTWDLMACIQIVHESVWFGLYRLCVEYFRRDHRCVVCMCVVETEFRQHLLSSCFLGHLSEILFLWAQDCCVMITPAWMRHLALRLYWFILRLR